MRRGIKYPVKHGSNKHDLGVYGMLVQFHLPIFLRVCPRLFRRLSHFSDRPDKDSMFIIMIRKKVKNSIAYSINANPTATTNQYVIRVVKKTDILRKNSK
jgi:hypothetical protein